MAKTTFTVGGFPDGFERLDRIAKHAYGSELGGTVEALLDANPHLASIANAVPVGTSIVVPDVVETVVTVVRPWV